MKLSKKFPFLIALLIIVIAVTYFLKRSSQIKQVPQAQKQEIAPEEEEALEPLYQSDYDGPPITNDWAISWLSANPTSLNPITSTDVYASEIESYIFDTLISFDSMTGDPIGRLAKSWDISEDGLTYEFELREDVKFHDGKPLTANDIKFTVDRIMDPWTEAAHLRNYYADLESVTVISPTRVRYKMKKKYFRNLIVLGLMEVLPAHVYGEGDFNNHPAARKPVGSGPYVFSKWESGRIVELKRNENWWGNNSNYWKHRYNFKRLLFRVITENSVAVMALKKGDIDSMEPTATQFVNDFKGAKFLRGFYKLKFETVDGDGYGYIGWNLRLPQFNDKRVRQALTHAMPREQIKKKIFHNIRTRSVGPFPKVSPKTDPHLDPIPYDIEKAKTLLKKAGWTDSDNDGLLDKEIKGAYQRGKEKLEVAKEAFAFELLVPQGASESERIALIYQQELKKLKIEMSIRVLEWTVFIKQMRERKYDAVMLGWGSSLDSDPYQIWHSSQIEHQGSNHVGYRNERIDEILEKARQTLNRKERNKLYHEFTRILADEAPYLFLFERPHLFVATRRFRNVDQIGKLGLDSPTWFTPPGLEKYKETARRP